LKFIVIWPKTMISKVWGNFAWRWDNSSIYICRNLDCLNIWFLKDQSPCAGQLEVWTSFQDVNFHCDFLKLFLEMHKYTSFMEICIFSNRLGKYKYTKKALKKNSCIHEKFWFIQCDLWSEEYEEFCFLGNYDIL
jgi:hypothetical protein